jgi:hypothetical protein
MTCLRSGFEPSPRIPLRSHIWFLGRMAALHGRPLQEVNDDCTEKLPVVLEGVPQIVQVKARVVDEHHISGDRECESQIC